MRTILRLGTSVILATGPFCSTFANPIGGVVQSGAATFNSSGSILSINQLTSRAVINWQGFSIGAGEVTRFNQPNGGAVLNRVTTSNPSLIYGTLEGNGLIFLINPNGILVGPSGQVNVNSFVATTLDVPNADFLKGGPLTFSGGSKAAVQNQGQISANGDVFLFGNSVQNSGTISGGTVGLAAGSSVQLTQPGSLDRVSVLAGNPSGAAVGVNNLGVIQAVSAELKAAGGNIYALAINNGGTVRATRLVNEGGRIVMRSDGGTVVNAGTLDASAPQAGGQGGTVQVTGGNIRLTDNSVVDVSGAAGGGTALIGGDYHGGNPAVPNADSVTAAPGSQITADALDNGNGGKVVVWSDSFTRFSGSITARGGAGGGNGGFAEVSSGGLLNYNATVDLSAAHGVLGQVLLDPPDAIVGTGSSADPTRSIIEASSVSSSAANFQIQADRDLAFNLPVAMTTANAGLVAEAGRNLTINQPITTSGGTMSFTASLTTPGTLAVNAPVGNLNSGSITFANSAPGGTVLNAGIISGGDLAFNSAVFLLNGSPTLQGNNVIFGGTVDSAVGSPVLAPNLALSPVTGGIAVSWPVGYQGFKLQQSPDFSTWTDVSGVNNNSYLSATPAFFRLAPSGAGQMGPAYQLGFSGSGANLVLQGNTSFATTVGGQGPLGTLKVVGTAAINGGSVTTSGDQNYGQTVTLGKDTVLSSSTLELSTVVGGGNSLELKNSGLATLGGVVNGVNVLMTDGAGNLAVNNSISAASVNDSEVTTLSGSTVTTSGDQTYGKSVTEGVDTHLTAATLTVGPSWDAATHDLTLTIGGAVTVPGVFANVNNFKSDGAGGTTINGNFTTAGGQTYQNAVTLSQNAVLTGTTLEFAQVTGGGNNLELKNSGQATLGGTVSGVGVLTADGAGNLAVNGPVSAGSVNDSEVTTLSGSTVTTTGDQSYGQTVTLGKDAVLSASTLELGTVVGGGNSLELKNSGLATLGGVVNGVGVLKADGGGNLAVNNPISAASVTDSEVTTLSGSTVTTSGDQTYGNSVTEGADTHLIGATLTVGPSWDAAMHGLWLTIGGGVTVPGVFANVNNFKSDGAGGTTINGNFTTAGGQTYQTAVTLGQNVVLTGTTLEFAQVTGGGNNLELKNSGQATLGGTVSGVGVLKADGGGNLVVNSSISAGSVADSEVTTLSGSTVTTGGDQNYSQTVTLGKPTALTSSTLELAQVSLGANSLEIKNSGQATLGGTVSGTGGLTADGAGTLAVNGSITAGSVADSEVTTLSGSTVTTGGDQKYSQTVTLGKPTVLTSSTLELAQVGLGANSLELKNSGQATLGGTVSGTGGLMADGAGTLAVNGPITAGSVADSEVTTLSGSTVTTGGDQSYGQTVTLGKDAVLSSSTLELSTVVGGGNSLELKNSGLATLGGVVNGVGVLKADGAGNLAVNNSISAASVNDSEVTTLSGSTVTTSGDQTYGNSVTEGADTHLIGATLTVGPSWDAAMHDLTLTIGGAVTVPGVFAKVNNFKSDGAGGTTIDGNFTTAGGQTYQTAVTLGQNVVLTGTTLEFAQVGLGANNLELKNSGQATLGGTVSGTGGLTADGAGTLAVNGSITAGSVADSEVTTLSGSTVTTGGDQKYSQTVTLGKPTVLTSSTLELAQVGLGANSLELKNSGQATLGGTVSGTGGLTADGAGTLAVNGSITAGSVADSEVTTLSGSTVTTGGDQKYTQTVTLTKPTVLTSSMLELAQVGLGANSLELKNSGQATLGGTVSGTGGLTADGAGTLAVNGSITAGSVADSEVTTLSGSTVTTSGDQSYGQTVTLGKDTVLTSSSLKLSAVEGAANKLTLDNSGGVTGAGPIVAGTLELDGTGNVVSGSTAGRLEIEVGALSLDKPAPNTTLSLLEINPDPLKPISLNLSGTLGPGFTRGAPAAATDGRLDVLVNPSGPANGPVNITQGANTTDALVINGDLALHDFAGSITLLNQNNQLKNISLNAAKVPAQNINPHLGTITASLGFNIFDAYTTTTYTGTGIINPEDFLGKILGAGEPSRPVSFELGDIVDIEARKIDIAEGILTRSGEVEKHAGILTRSGQVETKRGK